MSNIKQNLAKSIKALQNKKITQAHLNAEVILSFVLQKPKEFIFTHPEFGLSKSQEKLLNKLIVQVGRGMPTAYLIGHKEFYGLDFLVNKNVLIPRPDSELLVGITQSVILSPSKYGQIKNIAEIGTGSGCLILSLANLFKGNKNILFFATDICQKALSVAKKNARRLGLANKVKFYRGNLLHPLQNKRIDILIANLPYLSAKWKNKSLQFEPSKALFAKEGGLFLYKKMFEQATKLKNPPKIILCEFDPRQSGKIKKLAQNFWPKAKLKIFKDIANRDRVVKIQLF